MWTLLSLLLLQYLLASSVTRLLPDADNVPYSRFVQLVRQHKVDEAFVGAHQIGFTVKPERPIDPGKAQELRTTVPLPESGDSLAALLDKYNVGYTVLPPEQDSWLSRALGWLVPMLIFFGVWGYLQSRMRRGPFMLGRNNIKMHAEGETGVRFSDVAGVDEARAELEEIVDFLRNSQRYQRLGARIPKGILLVGPPGTGKTLLARAVAGEANVPFFSISGSEFIELFVGMGAARVRELFEQAKAKAPCIVFIDELDALGKARSGHGMAISHDEREQTLNQLLSEMDGFEANNGVLILAATNRPEVLDPALRRPGRFDRMVVVDRPDRSGRAEILKVHSRGLRLDPDVQLDSLAARTAGLSGADLANLMNEAALLAARRHGSRIENGDVGEALERVVAGLQKRSRILTDEERAVVAYHEVGHALVGALLSSGEKVEKITIVPRGKSALGYTLRVPEDDRFLTRETELEGTLAMLLAGRAAEKLTFGQTSSGAADDLQRATELAERAVALYGMSQKLGPVAVQRPSEYLAEQGLRRPVSPYLSQMVDEEVQERLREASDNAYALLEHNRELLEEMARALLAQETLEGPPLHEWLARARQKAHTD
jgi:cell division protease FtsH